MKLSEYVTQVISDPKYGHDIEWVRANLNRAHMARIESIETAEPSDARNIIGRALVRSAHMDTFSAWDLASEIVAALRASAVTEQGEGNAH